MTIIVTVTTMSAWRQCITCCTE